MENKLKLTRLAPSYATAHMPWPSHTRYRGHHLWSGSLYCNAVHCGTFRPLYGPHMPCQTLFHVKLTLTQTYTQTCTAAAWVCWFSAANSAGEPMAVGPAPVRRCCVVANSVCCLASRRSARSNYANRSDMRSSAFVLAKISTIF